MGRVVSEAQPTLQKEAPGAWAALLLPKAERVAWTDQRALPMEASEAWAALLPREERGAWAVNLAAESPREAESSKASSEPKRAEPKAVGEHLPGPQRMPGEAEERQRAERQAWVALSREQTLPETPNSAAWARDAAAN